MIPQFYHTQTKPECQELFSPIDKKKNIYVYFKKMPTENPLLIVTLQPGTIFYLGPSLDSDPFSPVRQLEAQLGEVKDGWQKIIIKP